MECLISDIVVSKETMNKISSSGFCFQHLQLELYSRNCIDGLTQLFKVACLVVLGLTALSDSISVYIGSSPKELVGWLFWA